MKRPGAPVHEEIPLSPGVRLRVLPDKRFKNVQLRVHLHRPLDQDSTRGALLPSVLRRGCRRLETMDKIARFLENLYGASYGSDVQKMGDQQVLGFHVEVLADRYVPRGKGTLDRAVGLLGRLISEPVLRNKGLHPEYVAGEKQNLRRLIEGLVNDRAAYAWERCLRATCAGEPHARYEYGDVADLDAIGPADLAEWHRKLLATSTIEILASGDVSPSAIARLFRKHLELPRRAPALIPPTVLKPAASPPREIRETMEVEQGNLVISCRTGRTWKDDDVPDLSFANAVLGGFPHSKLFRNVRERDGLAYGTSSGVDFSKGLLVITAGIDVGKYEPARRTILEQLDALKQGDISDEEMDKTRASLLNRIRTRDDSPSTRLAVLHEQAAAGRAWSSAELMERYAAVTRESAAAAARLIGLDTVYFLTRPS